MQPPKLPPIAQQGDALRRDVADAPGPAVWWLGQHSFIVKLPTSGGGKTIYIDPYLSPSDARQVPPLLTPDQVHADIIIGTHDHSDHIDRPIWPALAEASDATFVAPQYNLPELAESTGVAPSRIVAFNDGESRTIHGISLTAHASAHERLETRDGLHRWLGFVIEADGVVIHHPGDTCIYEGLITKLRLWQGRIDLALYPINGRDAERLKRNCLGNMTYQEAVDLAGELAVKRVIPTHWDMFAGNPGDPDAFETYLGVKWPDVKCVRPRYGERVQVGKT